MTEKYVPPVALTLNQLLAMVRWHLPTITKVAALMLLLTGGLLMVLPKTYVSTAEIFFDYRVNDPISGRQFPAMLDESHMQTQLDIIKSAEVANRVIDAQKLLDHPSTPADRQKLVEQMINSIDIQLRQTSRIVEVSFSSDTPDQAQAILSAWIKAYLDISSEMNSAPAKSRLEQYNAQLDLLRNEIDLNQRRITEYQQSTGILDADERLDLSARQLGELAKKFLDIQGNRQEAEAKLRMLDSLGGGGFAPAELPEIAEQPRITELKLRQFEIERNLKELSAVYGKRHPKIVALMEEQQLIAQRVQREAKAEFDSRRLEAKRLAAQEKYLADEIDHREKAVLEMKKHRDVLSSYSRQLESSQRIYNAALQKYDEILMSGSVHGNSLSVLRPPDRPSKPAKPKRGKSLIAGLLSGVLLGICIALFLEFSNRRVRCTDDVERELGWLVLGRLGSQPEH